MTIDALLFNLKQIEDAGNGDNQLSYDFGHLKKGCRMLSAIEEDIMDEEAVILYPKPQSQPPYTISEFISIIKDFIKDDKDLMDKCIVLKRKNMYQGTSQKSVYQSILYLTKKFGPTSPATFWNINAAAYIKDRIDKGINWMKELFDMKISAAELPTMEPDNYKRDYLEYIRMRDQLSAHIKGELSENKERRDVFVNAVSEFSAEYQEDKYCEWIKYDCMTLCPKWHDINNPYWRIPENLEKLKYCPYCGKEIKIVD